MDATQTTCGITSPGPLQQRGVSVGSPLNPTQKLQTTKTRPGKIGQSHTPQPGSLSRRQVTTLLNARLNDPRVVEKYAQEAKAVKDHNVSYSHRQRRMRIEKQISIHKGNLPGLFRMWEDTVGPRSAKSYIGTCMKEHPELINREVEDAADRIRQKAPVLGSKRAIPITIPQFRRLLKQAPAIVRNTIIVLILSASRHMDLLRVLNYRSFQKGIILLQWANFKSDRYGERAFSKFIEIPEAYRHLWRPFEIATYRQVYNELKKVDPSLSVHSLRRAAVTCLADAGFSYPEILLLTGHTPTADPCLAVRRYADPSPNQPESLLQIKMSRCIAMIFGLVSAKNRY